MSYVAADDHDATVRIVDHLKSRGRHRIATITGPLDTPGGQQRLAGYRHAVESEFDPRLVANGDYSSASGAAAMTQLLAAAPDLDAVFAANDRMAEGALSILNRNGRRIPDDVAVAGFDDSPVATRCTPQLTTMRQPFERISTEMVRLLLAEIAGEGIARVILPAELVIRDST